MKWPVRPARTWSQKAPASTPQLCSLPSSNAKRSIRTLSASLPSPLLAVRASRVLASRFPMKRERVRDGDERGGRERGRDRSSATTNTHLPSCFGCHHSQSARGPNMTTGIEHPYLSSTEGGDPADRRIPRVPTSRCLLPTAWVTQSGPNPCEPVSRGRRQKGASNLEREVHTYVLDQEPRRRTRLATCIVQRNRLGRIRRDSTRAPSSFWRVTLDRRVIWRPPTSLRFPFVSATPDSETIPVHPG